MTDKERTAREPLMTCGTWEPGAPMLTEKFKWKPHKDESTEVVHRGGFTRSSEEVW
jgi:hypothetical protein